MLLVAQQVTLDICLKLDSIWSVVLTHICSSFIVILTPGEGETHELSPLSRCLQVDDLHWLSGKGWGGLADRALQIPIGLSLPFSLWWEPAA